jgi:lysophospholipase L1-like esterase
VRRTALLVALLVLGLLGVPGAVSPEASAGGPVRALMVGDSILEGAGAKPRRPVMARVAGRLLGWELDVDGIGGTGYVNSGRAPGNTYLERLARTDLSGYDVVVVEGGHNDWRADPGLVADRVREVVAHVRRRAPEAQLVLVGAYDPPGVRLRGPVDRVVASVAAEQDVPFTSPISGGWAEGVPSRFLSGDRLHPSTWGYGVLGKRLAADLAALTSS